MKRVFLGWKSGALEAAARYLCSHAGNNAGIAAGPASVGAEASVSEHTTGDDVHPNVNGLVDLSRHTIVVPNSRAGRRLREVLLDHADREQLALFPPQVTTVGHLPELLYEGKLPFAAPLVQQLAWAKALKTTPHPILKRVLVQYPDRPDDPRWMELGALLQRQHLELTEHRLDFGTVAERGEQIEGFTDGERWRSLAKIQRRYLDVLHELQLWDRQTARNFAVEHGECRFDGHLVLLGTVDLSETLRAMVAQLQCDVTALVVSDSRRSDFFDEFGCVVPDAWQTFPLNVEDHQVLVADGPANQADAVVLALDQLEVRYAAEEIAIGVPDPSLVPYLESRLKQVRIPARWGPGRSLLASPPFQWLRLVAEYLDGFPYESLAELVRHDATQRFLFGAGYRSDSVKELDRYFANRLPDRLHRNEPHPGELPQAIDLVCDLLDPLYGEARQPSTHIGTHSGRAKRKTDNAKTSKIAAQADNTSPSNRLRRPAAWGEAIQQVLLRLYESQQLRRDVPQDRLTLLACEQIALSIERFAVIPEELSPSISASTAILMILSQIEEDEVASPAGREAVEMLGWLELPLDDSKVAIVTSMNDGVVPKAVSSDVFLPNTFRQLLGLDDNARRYARDAYAVDVLQNSKMVARYVVGRRTVTNDPLRPSRLLLACHRDRLAKRCLRLFDGPADCAPWMMPVERDVMSFEVPRPRPLTEPLDSMSVSDFARYLTCPYRFYLTKVQRLRSIDDRAREVDAATFGDIAHRVLEWFGQNEIRDSDDEEEIRDYLISQLTQLGRDQFGKHPKPTVRIQLAQLRTRFAAFASQQAKWRAEGWSIVQTEFNEDHGELIVDGEPMRLRGRIDRIDCRESTDGGGMEYAVLDYKTGDRGETPDQKHLKSRDGKFPGHWVDLQLPLYVHLLQSFPRIKNCPIRLGYVLLPSDGKACKFAMADWGAEELKAANEVAADVVRAIRAEQFWPPAEPYPFAANDDFAAIVQQGIFGRETLVAEASA